MPELPEVQTTVNGLRQLIGVKISDVWTAYNSSYFKGKKNIKDPAYFEVFKRNVVGAKISEAERKAKNVLIHLDNGFTILVHMKMTGHFLYGNYIYDNKHQHKWVSANEGPLKDPFNRFVRLVFTLGNGRHLVLSDMRKFAKVAIVRTADIPALE